MTKKVKNELYALHLDGQIIHPDIIWRVYSQKYGDLNLQGWRPPKKIYHTLGHARNGRRHLPNEIQSKVKIVKYLPIEEVD